MTITTDQFGFHHNRGRRRQRDQINFTAAANDAAALQSCERGRYKPGKYQPNERSTSALTLSKATSTTRVPILTFQRNSTASLYIPCRLNGLDAIVSADSVIDVVLNGTLTGASYGAIPGINSPETAMQVDTTASAISGGNLLYSTLVTASGAGSKTTGSTVQGGLSLDVPLLQSLSICVRTITGTGTASVVGRMIEDW